MYAISRVPGGPPTRSRPIGSPGPCLDGYDSERIGRAATRRTGGLCAAAARRAPSRRLGGIAVARDHPAGRRGDRSRSCHPQRLGGHLSNGDRRTASGHRLHLTGDLLGTESLVGAPAPFSVQAVTPVVLCVCPATEISRLMGRSEE